MYHFLFKTSNQAICFDDTVDTQIISQTENVTDLSTFDYPTNLY